MLQDDNRGYVGWGRARAYDLILSLQWLLENEARFIDTMEAQDLHQSDGTRSEEFLLDTMRLLSEHAFDWANFFSKDTFPRGDLDVIGWYKEYDYVHVVNMGQGMLQSFAACIPCRSPFSFQHSRWLR